VEFPIRVQKHSTLVGHDGKPLDLDEVARLLNLLPDCYRVLEVVVHSHRSKIVVPDYVADDANAILAGRG
jgi:hypothetical protein